MKRLTYYLIPVIITTLFIYAIGAMKAADFNPEHFGYKTRMVLAATWGLILGYWLLWRRLHEKI